MLSDKIKIYPNSRETQVSVAWSSDLGSNNYVHVTVYPEGINVAATGTLNAEGIEALDIAMTVSKAIFTHGLEIS